MIRIVIDTREQTPLHFPPQYCETEIGTLRTGDYALKDDPGFAVERKSLDDFLGTISSGWERFQREIYRAKESGFTLPIVVEANMQDLFYIEQDGKINPPPHNHPNLTSRFVISRIGELAMIGANTMFADNAVYATAIVYSLLHARAKILGRED